MPPLVLDVLSNLLIQLLPKQSVVWYNILQLVFENCWGGCLEAPSLPPLSHLKWFIYGKSRVIQGNLYKNIQGNLGKTEGNRRKSRETRGNNSIKSWSYVGDSMIHRASENPPQFEKEASSSKPLRSKALVFEGIWTPKNLSKRRSKGWEDYKVGPLPVITGFITPTTRVIRTVSHL